jgi:hypothetical protein
MSRKNTTGSEFVNTRWVPSMNMTSPSRSSEKMARSVVSRGSRTMRSQIASISRRGWGSTETISMSMLPSRRARSTYRVEFPRADLYVAARRALAAEAIQRHAVHPEEEAVAPVRLAGVGLVNGYREQRIGVPANPSSTSR